MLLPSLLLNQPDTFFARLDASSLLASNARLFAGGSLGAACWGAAMGAHVGGANIAVTALKMPLFFAATLALCFVLMHVVALAGGIRASATQTLHVALAGLSVTALCLGAFAPVLALFAACAPTPSMASYLNLYVACALAGVVAGVFGAARLAAGLRALNGRSATGVLFAWLFIYQFTGTQVAWVLRPWIGGADYSLAHGLSGNFYVGAGRVFLRWLS
ncbi:hypothetical protein PLCT1_00971 [Planctomycetaceae bacterium]|nr:hypothetical protein PLCT1_00971 [Planctomycetaceae bacterium]